MRTFRIQAVRLLWAALAAILAACCLSCCRAESGAFSCRLVRDITSYSENTFHGTAPAAGAYRITVRDDTTVYRELEGRIEQAGAFEIPWDGTGFNEERLDPRAYLIETVLRVDDGTEYTDSFRKASEYSAQAVNYALPSATTLNLRDTGAWFLEAKAVMDGTLEAEWIPEGAEGPEKTGRVAISGGKAQRFSYKALAGSYRPKEGFYTLRIYDGKNPGYGKDIRIEVIDREVEAAPIGITEEFMPGENDSPADIWRKMMLPSVVVDIGFHQHQKIYETPDRKAKSLGTVHGQTQGLKVIALEGTWAKVGAWNHETGAYVEGWVPKSVLKTETPQTDYGLLFDKQTQVLTVFHQGEIYDTLKISTGLGEEKKLYQETSAGSFLTGYHRNSFSSNGKKFDYVIQYDGGNMIHQIPYYWGNGKKNFAAGTDQLGTKASHGCIRIQAEPSENKGINAYWLWTHIPYHTRVIVLEGAVEGADQP